MGSVEEIKLLEIMKMSSCHNSKVLLTLISGWQELYPT